MVKQLRLPVAVSPLRTTPGSSSRGELADFVLPRHVVKKPRLAEEAPVLVGLQRYSANSGLCGLGGPLDTVVVAMLAHEARPSHFYKFVETFGEFLAHTESKNPGFPSTLRQFEQMYEVRMVMS